MTPLIALCLGQKAFFQLREQGTALVSALFSLFKKNAPIFSHSSSIADRKIEIGGVENTGNSCIFSVLLQEFATLQHLYHSLLSQPLQKCTAEPESRFAARKGLQESLNSCLNHINSGQRVTQTQIKELAKHLQTLGWQGQLSSVWRYYLHCLAPTLFSLPLFSIYELYETILGCLLAGNPFNPLKIHLTGKEDTDGISSFFESKSKLIDSPAPILWRVALSKPSSPLPELSFRIKSSEFSLSVIHAYRDTWLGRHVVVYRRSQEGWICCNDTKITHAAPSASDTIYTVVYESHPV